MYLFWFVLLSIVVIVFVAFGLYQGIAPELIRSEELKVFSTDITFQPFPQLINIENPYPCTGSDLKLCEVDNPLTCIGCQNLISRCQNFPNEMKYIDYDGVETLIPANSSANEGYCLPIIDAQNACNVYHGDLTLIQLTPDSTDTMIICNCRNPGAIGNTTLLGACDRVFICNGEVEDINRNLEDIKCACKKGDISVMRGNLPACRHRTVDEANPILNEILNKPSDNLVLLANTSENFPANIHQNVSSDFLINPCAFCPITGERNISATMTRTGENVACSVTLNDMTRNSFNEHRGIPIRRNKFQRLLQGDFGPDAILNVFWEEVLIYVGLEDTKQRFVFIFGGQGNVDFFKKLNLDTSKKYAIASDELLLVATFPTPRVNNKDFPNCICNDNFPWDYDCQWSQTSGGNNLMHDWQYIAPPMYEMAPRTNQIFVRHDSGDEPFSLYLWRSENWKQIMRLNRYYGYGQTMIGDKDYSYLTTTPEFFINNFAENVKYMCFGFKKVSDRELDLWKFVISTNNDLEDWRTLKARLIAYQ